MGITSLSFLSLAVASIFIYYLLGTRYRIPFLTLVSCGFIATYSYMLLFYVLIYSLINYYIGIMIPIKRVRKILFISGIVFNLLQLILLKYVSFTINPVLQLLNIDLDLAIISRIIIPVGVSFFTLQGIGYIINLYLGWEKPEKNFINFLLYIIFYPRFLSGPIDRSNRFLPQLKVKQLFNSQKIEQGFRLVLFGLFKKVAIANQLAPVVASAYANLGSQDGSFLWVILVIQPLYLYFDFSGYTDIAYGFARAYGIELMPNFNRPFMSTSMTEFLKRFHISLSSWFHDYIFIRTCFKYKKLGRKAANIALFLTWILFGIWHGAGWTFMLLGLLQALAIYYEFNTKRMRKRLFSKIPGIPRKWIARIITYLFFGTSLVFFFAPDINSVFLFYTGLFDGNVLIPSGIRKGIFFLVLLFIFIFLFFEAFKNDFSDNYNKIESMWFRKNIGNVTLRWLLYFALIAIILVFNKEVKEFIYFQF